MRRRRRRKTRKLVGPSSSSVRIETNSQMRATPSNSTLPRSSRWEPLRRVVFRDSQPRTRDPVQVARATTGNVHESRPAPPSQRLSTPSLSSIPIGLSAKELARLRAETLPTVPNSQMRATPSNLTLPRTTRWEPLRRVVFRDSQPRARDPVQVAPATTGNAHESRPAPPSQRLSAPSLLSIPIGLSAKELARLRAETLPTVPLETLQDPQSGQPAGASVVPDVHEPPLAPLTPQRRPPSPSMSSAPIGLSAKELARLRAETLRSQQIPVHHDESIEPQQFEPVTVTAPPVVTTDSTDSDSESEQDAAIPPSENRELRTVVESLQREVQRLREERFDAPPSYTEGGT